MNAFATFFLLCNAFALLVLPRRLAALPLLVGACYMTSAHGIDLGVFYFSVLRLLIAAGILRILLRGERLGGGFNGLDGLMVAWAAWALIASQFHERPGDYLVNSLGAVYNTCGVYFLIRCFCDSLDSVADVVRMTAILLVPVALEMVYEQLTGRNLFSLLLGIDIGVSERSGRFRAQGPFAHAILAGTVGAVCLPLMIGIWHRRPLTAKIGIAACILMVLASASSGPLISLIIGLAALLAWRWRHLTHQLRIAAVVGYILLDIVMKAPAYYLIARVDLVGGSAGWHRARLIQSAFQHLGEWWFAGTDYTRHWMPTGVPWSDDHADITNHFLAMGVRGGLPLMFLFIALLWRAFRYVGQALGLHQYASFPDRFFIWSLGAALFAHAGTCISVAYFDQSSTFLNLNLAVIGSLSYLGASEARSAKESLADVETYCEKESASRGRDAAPSPAWIP